MGKDDDLDLRFGEENAAFARARLLASSSSLGAWGRDGG